MSKYEDAFCHFREFRLRNHFILAQVYAKITRFSVSARILLKYIHFFWKNSSYFQVALSILSLLHIFSRKSGKM
jgi:hypothetical protein